MNLRKSQLMALSDSANKILSCWDCGMHSPKGKDTGTEVHNLVVTQSIVLTQGIRATDKRTLKEAALSMHLQVRYVLCAV